MYCSIFRSEGYLPCLKSSDSGLLFVRGTYGWNKCYSLLEYNSSICYLVLRKSKETGIHNNIPNDSMREQKEYKYQVIYRRGEHASIYSCDDPIYRIKGSRRSLLYDIKRRRQ